MKPQLVWFKRDLRVVDHLALWTAAQSGPVLPLFVVEPDYWQQSDASARQWAFVQECLTELREALARLGQPLLIRTGPILDVLSNLHAKVDIAALHSHEETGNAWTFARDRLVGEWCRENGIPWHEYRQNGVERGNTSRNGWAKRWDIRMAEALVPTPPLQPVATDDLGDIPTSTELGLLEDPCPERQPGGRSAGLERLYSFLQDRGETYRSAMSSPLSGAHACSRMSPHFAWGTVSMREAAQVTWARQRTLKIDPDATKTWRGSMRSYSGRLHWHCHFMQKLEDAPELEHRNLHAAYDGIRPAKPDRERLQAWQNGETGLPFDDACMRSLRATGWLNFRMRSMLMAVASYHLWLDWRAPGLHLAQQFTDYEPGIHWPQVQMQSGTTGINTVRIYNPVKQGHDQDPNGAFVRRWVPELREIDDQFLQEPWRADNAACVLGRTYPFPIVDHIEAAKAARQKIWSVRKTPGFRDVAKSIQVKHGSRKGARRPKRSQAAPDSQLSLPLGE